ncbi:MAG: hypothetical protein GY768_26290 [Planctomycetaceae bacterium]|nr:hypothetical protein [Planctomycetaceae bacterium]
MDDLQNDLEQNRPDLDIQILGMNPVGHEIGNADTTEGRDIPWLQDVDLDGDDQSDTWLTTWPGTYRDVVIVDANNVAVDVFNLTTNSLEETDGYNALRQMLIDVAEATIDPIDDAVFAAVDGNLDIDVLANDAGNNRLTITDVTQPAHGFVEITVAEYPADLDPMETFMPQLVISEVVPDEYIELFNAGYERVELSQVEQVLVSSADDVRVGAWGAGEAIPVRGYLQLEWPDGFTMSDESGELILYRDGQTGFDDASKIDDFVAWGAPVDQSRIALAELVGKWEGEPDGSLDLGAIQRIPGTRGEEAHAYDNHRPSTPGTAINGAVDAQQILRYTPASSYLGPDSFEYSVVDDQGSVGTASVEVNVSDAAAVWSNPVNSLDVDSDGSVTEADAHSILARLNAGLTGWLPATMVWPMTPPGFVDCNANGSIEPLDALMVLNHLNAAPSVLDASSSGNATDESVTLPVTDFEPQALQGVAAALASTPNEIEDDHDERPILLL